MGTLGPKRERFFDREREEEKKKRLFHTSGEAGKPSGQ